MRQRGGILALLAALGAMTYHFSSGNSSSGPAKDGETSALSEQSSTGGLERVFGAFDRRRIFRIDLGKPDVLRTELAPDVNLSGAATAAFEWVIAIVPDPQNSNMKLDFDRSIEMIQLAARNAGYQFERYWLPWRDSAVPSREKEYAIRTTDSHNGEPGLATIEAQGDRAEGLPGVLLFRNQRSKPLALFLVGDSPTGGVAGDQFRAAVRLGRALASLEGSKPDKQLRIIGPGFSGSLAPLSTLILSEAGGFESVVVRTLAMNPEAKSDFLSAFNGKPVQLDFQSLEVNSRDAIKTFTEYVRRYWREKTPFVILTEEGTVFGDAKSLGGLIWTIPFPRNLTQLRNATEKQEHLPGFEENSGRNSAPRNGLIMSLRQETSAKLEFPVFSKEQTPLSQESVLFTISDLLKTNTIHYVGVMATDPLDNLFLVRYLRSSCPNIRIFTLTPDLLIEHGSDSSDFSGIIGVSAYPLFPFSQLWSGSSSSGKLYAFAGHAAEGVYNSALEIFQKIPTSSAHTDPHLDLRDKSDPFSRRKPLWITVAGRSGFEPVAVLNPPEDSVVNLPAAGQQNFAIEYWPGWGYTFSLILSFCLIFCALMLFAQRNGHPVVAMFSAQPDNYLSGDHYDPVPRAFYLYSTGICLAILTAVWLVVPGVVVMQNLSGGGRFRLVLVELTLPIIGALLIIVMQRLQTTPHRLRPAVSTAPQPSPAGRIAFFAASGPLFLTLPGLLMNPFPGAPTSTLPNLWLFFCCGCFCVGAIFAASLCPVLALRPFMAAAARDTSPNGQNWRFSWHYSIAAALLSTFAAVLIAFAGFTITADKPLDFMAAYRSLDLTNGVSPIVPVTFLFGGLIVLAVVQLRRMTCYEDRRPEVPGMHGDEFCPKLDGIVKDVVTGIRRITRHPSHYLVLLIVAVLAAGIFRASAQTLERRTLEYLILISALSVAVLLLLVWIRLLLVWSAFAEFLQELERHPIRQIFSLLPRGFVWSPVWQGGGKRRTHVAITRSLESMHALLNHTETPQDLKDAIRKELDCNNPDSLASQVQGLLAASARRRRFSRPQYRTIEMALREISEKATKYLRWAKWNRGDYELRYELATKEETKDALHTPRPEYMKQEPATICGELVAFRFLAFINFVLWHIDNFVTYVSVGFLLLVIALNSYAFRSRTIIDWLLVLLFLVLSAGIITIFAQADRDAILSRITGTAEGKLDRHFFTHLVSYGAIPLLVLMATHFPTIGRFFFSWVKPAMEAIH